VPSQNVTRPFSPSPIEQNLSTNAWTNSLTAAFAALWLYFLTKEFRFAAVAYSVREYFSSARTIYSVRQLAQGKGWVWR